MLKVKRAADLGGRPLRVLDHAAHLEDVLVRSKRLRRSTVAAVSGLVICQKIVGRYGAELGGVGVWAGSTFRFTIPV